MIKQLNNVSETVEPLGNCWWCDGGTIDCDNCCLCDGAMLDILP